MYHTGWKTSEYTISPITRICHASLMQAVCCVTRRQERDLL